jgi:ArsR family transcriptional regulator, arsenate/arsenite/antimonite-responsive transcriptional repressor
MSIQRVLLLQASRRKEERCRCSNPLTIFNVLCYPAGMDTTILGRPLPVRYKNEPCSGPVAAPSLTQVQTDQLAARLKALGDPTRLRLLDLLAQQPAPLCVCDLTPQFSQNQPTISHHLKLLRETGLIDSERQGIWAYYWATEEGRRTLAAIKTLT